MRLQHGGTEDSQDNDGKNVHLYGVWRFSIIILMQHQKYSLLLRFSRFEDNFVYGNSQQLNKVLIQILLKCFIHIKLWILILLCPLQMLPDNSYSLKGISGFFLRKGSSIKRTHQMGPIHSSLQTFNYEFVLILQVQFSHVILYKGI